MKTKFRDKVQNFKKRLGGSGSTPKVSTRSGFISVIAIIVVVLVSGSFVFIFNQKDKESVYDGSELVSLAATLETEREMYLALRDTVQADIDRLEYMAALDVNGLSSLVSEALGNYNAISRIVSSGMSMILGYTSSQLSIMRTAFGGTTYFYDYFSSNSSFDGSSYAVVMNCLTLYDATDGAQIYNYYGTYYLVDRSRTYVDATETTIYAVDLLYSYYSFLATAYEALWASFDSYEDYVAEKDSRYAIYSEAYSRYSTMSLLNGSGINYYNELLVADVAYLARLDAIIYALDLELERLNSFLSN